MTGDPGGARAEYRELPPVGEMLQSWETRRTTAGVPPELLAAWIREATEEARAAIRAAGEAGTAPPIQGRVAWAAWIDERVTTRLDERATTEPRRVINATGILLHTNLGRSPWSAPALRMMWEAAGGYSSLEMDLDSGRRRSRLDPIRRLLPLVTGAEAGIAVHNNAAAVYLALVALAAGREVIVSRGHLVEIGGSFRLPEIMAASGAKLVEVGSTNRTRLSDYEKAIGPDTALLLQVHPSNFRLVGFTEEVATMELAALSVRHRLPLMYDVGSGALRRHGAFAFGEPTVEQALEDGADLVSFSGDKLLGGPQAGILVGRQSWIERLSRHPVARVVRLDKIALAALAGSLEAWLDPKTAPARIPLLALLARQEEELEQLAEELQARLRPALPPPWSIEVTATEAEVGGGSLPGVTLPSRAVALTHPSLGLDAIARKLRRGHPAVAGRIEQDRLLLDVRALLPGDVERIAAAVASLVPVAERT